MFAALYTPGFYLQAALRHDDAAVRARPVAIVGEEEKPPRILQCTRAARRAGVREGMTSTQGLARCAGLEVRYRRLDQERMAAAALLQCAGGASPLVEETGPGVCTLDWKGLPAAALDPTARDLVRQLKRQGLIAKIGIAATPGLALLAARNARPVFHVAGIDDLRDLPIAAVDPAPRLRELLRKLGVRKVGQFSELPPGEIAVRFGEEGLLLWQCIMGRGGPGGREGRLLKLVTPPQNFEEGIEFENEIELLEPLLFMLRRFVECITERLGAAYLVAAALDLRIGFVAGPAYTHAFPIPTPTRDVETLYRMLFTHLENFQGPHPIVSLHLAARPCKAVKEQLGLFETSLRDPNQFHQTLARLCALVGADRVGVPVRENTFRPDAIRMQSPAFPAPAPVRTGKPPRGLALRRCRPPRPAHVFTVERRPASLVLGDFSAPLGQSSGPWPLSGEWWEAAQAWDRTEWEVEAADGRLYRIFQQNGAWFIDGIYD